MDGGSFLRRQLPLLLLALATVWIPAQGAERTVRRASALREGPGSFFPVVTTLEPGAAVTLSETRGTWVCAEVAGDTGWLPQLALEDVRTGVDYAGMLHSGKAVVISSVDIAAATKGAFEANYSETHKVDFARVDELEQLRIPPALVTRIHQSLTPAGSRVLNALPRPVFENTVIIREDAEHLLGRALTATLVSAGFVDDSHTLAYVNAVAAVVGAYTPRYDLPFRVAVVEEDAINGFGLPGGNVVLSRGLVESVASEAELACLIGHEIAHITRYHGLREFQQRAPHRKRDSAFAELESETGADDPFADLNALTGETNRAGVEADLTRLANTSYLRIIGRRAREDELEADLFGAAYAAAAGYDPNALVSYLERMRDRGMGPDTFRHHPPVQERISALRAGIRTLRLNPVHPLREEARFMVETAGLRRRDLAE